MRNNKELVNTLCQSGVLKTPRIIDAFEAVDRGYFVPLASLHEAYVDAPLPIGEGQTISQPWTVAFMLELLSPKSGDNILDIGSGSGWTTALLAHIVGDRGSVIGVERHAGLVAFGAENLSKRGIMNAKICQASAVLGLPGESFDGILVSASADEVPKALFDQLNIGAHLVIPVGSTIYCFKKISDEEVQEQVFEGFRFVPLIYLS